MLMIMTETDKIVQFRVLLIAAAMFFLAAALLPALARYVSSKKVLPTPTPFMFQAQRIGLIVLGVFAFIYAFISTR